MREAFNASFWKVLPTITSVCFYKQTMVGPQQADCGLYILIRRTWANFHLCTSCYLCKKHRCLIADNMRIG